MTPAGDDLHYSDGTHRWVPLDPSVCVEAWAKTVRAHQEEAKDAGGCDKLAEPALPQRVPSTPNRPVIPRQRSGT